MGSPPYTWGALHYKVNEEDVSRITPIYMGSTDDGFGETYTCRDHPHIHGEHLTTVSGGGSCWITPIYMGSTLLERSLALTLEDHPHIHGEHPNASLVVQVI